MGVRVIEPENRDNIPDDAIKQSTASTKRASLRFRLSMILILAPLLPSLALLAGLYYLFRYYLSDDYMTALTMTAVLAAIIVLIFFITVFINIFAIKKYVTVPIMGLVERVSKFRSVMASSGVAINDQSDSEQNGDTTWLDDIMRSVENFRTVEGMTKRIRQLEVEIDKIYYDPLTGLYNRRYLDENIDRIMNSLSRSDGMLSILMVDIDHFKDYNDEYGHLQGDTCLKNIAEAILNSIERADDFVVRYGGEEFAIVLPNTDKTGALHVTNTMIENIKALELLHENSPVSDKVTVSIGVTNGIVKHTHKAEDFLRRADEMLYKSKQNGRNMYSYCDSK